MILYLDSSALAKRYLAESGSAEVGRLIRQATPAGTSILARAEVPAALAKAARLNWLERGDAKRLAEAFRADWASLFVVQATEAVMSLADTLAWEHGLRGYDAVHLASALVWQSAVNEPLTVATFDRQMWQAAPSAGLPVWPERLD